jgi:ribosome-binding factor A
MRKRQGASGRSPRQLRVGEELRHALVRVLQRGHLHDPQLENVQVTVTEVRVSPDLRNATAYVTRFGGGDTSELISALNRAGGYFRTELAHEVNLRMAPTIRFAADTTFAQANRIEELLHDPRVARDLAPAAEPKPRRRGRKAQSADGA